MVSQAEISPNRLYRRMVDDDGSIIQSGERFIPPNQLLRFQIHPESDAWELPPIVIQLTDRKIINIPCGVMLDGVFTQDKSGKPVPQRAFSFDQGITLVYDEVGNLIAAKAKKTIRGYSKMRQTSTTSARAARMARYSNGSRY